MEKLYLDLKVFSAVILVSIISLELQATSASSPESSSEYETCSLTLPNIFENSDGCAELDSYPYSAYGTVEFMWAKNDGGNIIPLTPFSTSTALIYCPSDEGYYRICARVVGCSDIVEGDDIYLNVCGANFEHVDVHDESGCDANDGSITHDPYINLGTVLPYYVTYTYESVLFTFGPYTHNQDYTISGLSPGVYQDFTMIDADGCEDNYGDITIEEYTIGCCDSVDALAYVTDNSACGDIVEYLEPCNCACDGKMTSITLQYNGVSGSHVAGYSENGMGGDFIASYDNVQNGDILTFSAAGLSNGEFKSTTWFYVNGGNEIDFHTSCSQEIAGLTTGDFTVVGYIDGAGQICEALDCFLADCECNGRVAVVTVIYDGPAGATVTSTNGDNSDAEDTGSYINVQPGDILVFSAIGVTDQDKFNNDLFVYLDGAYQNDFHTSCSDDLLGMTAGPMTVVQVTDSEGGTCGSVSTSPNCNGTIDLTVTSGVAPYTYLWSNGETSEDLLGLCSGTYSVVVTDAEGCENSFSFEVGSDPGLVAATATSTPNESCVENPEFMLPCDCECDGKMTNLTLRYNGPDGANVSAYSENNLGGEFIASYEDVEAGDVLFFTAAGLNNGEFRSTTWFYTDGANETEIHTSCSQDIAALTIGDFTVIGYTDGSGQVCESDNCFSTECPCEGRIAQVTLVYDGAAGADIYGANGHYDDSPIVGSYPNVQPGDVLTFSAVGTTDYNEFNKDLTIYVDGVNVQELHTSCSQDLVGLSFAGLTVVNQIDSEGNMCGQEVTGYPCTGAIDLTVTDGTAPFTFYWSNGASSEDLDGLCSGDYTVIICDANGCSTELTVTVDHNPGEVLASLSSTPNAVCDDEPCEPELPCDCACDGKMTSLTLLYNGPDGATVSGYTDDQMGGEFIGSYDNVANGQILTFDASGLDNQEFKSKTFFYTNGVEETEIHTSCSQDIAGLNIGNYTVIGYTDGSGQVCEATNCYTSECVCDGGVAIVTVLYTGASGATINGSDGDYDAGTFTNVQNGDVLTFTAEGLGTGEKFGELVVFIDGVEIVNYHTSCSEDLPGKVDGDLLVLSMIDREGNFCGTSCEDSDCTGSIDLTISTGTAPFTYAWSNGATTEDISGVCAGDYTVFITDALGCTTTLTTTIENTEGEAYELTGSAEFCIDGEPDFLTDSDIQISGDIVGDFSTFIITEDDGTILGLPETLADLFAVNFDEASPGTCLIWHIAYLEGLIGLEVDANATELEGCFELNGPIEVIRKETSSVGDLVWEDANGNGCQDIDEQGVEGLTLTLYTCADDGSGNPTPTGGVEVASTTSDANGFYEFTDCFDPSAFYYINISGVPAGFELTQSDACGDDTVDSDADSDGNTECFNIPEDGKPDCDFGISGLPNIGDYVWYDTDQDGIQDPDEVGVEGVTVNLVSAGPDGLFHTDDDVIVDTQVTDSDGGYLFEDVVPGLYCIEFVESTLPADFVFTNADQGGDDELDSDADPDGKTDPFTVVSGQDDDLSYDAGIVPCVIDVSLLGPDQRCAAENAQFQVSPPVEGATYSWSFTGNPTLVGPNDGSSIILSWPNVPGTYAVTVIIFDGECNDEFSRDIIITEEVIANAGPDGEVCQGGSTQLDGSGSSTFANFLWSVQSGDFTSIDIGATSAMPIVSPLQTTTYTLTVTDPVNGCTSVDQVTVVVNVNLNPTALAEAQDVGCAGLPFTLTAENSQSPIDDPTASLSFQWFLNGNVISTSESFETTTEGTTEYTLIAFSNNTGCTDTTTVSVTPIDCANIGDYVWYDDDRDGIQDPDETGVEGVTVNLVSAGPDGLFHTTDDVVVDTQITDANGNYLFEDVAPGLYCIEFVGSTLPADYVFTLTDQGGDDEADSDAAADGKTEPFTVVGGQDDDLSFDAGINLPTASLGDYVWEDTDQDGVQDPDEMGVEGVTVSLYICGEDTPIATTTTDENGFYIFEGLEPNTEYYVVFSDLPAEYVFTDADQGGDEALDSDAGDNGETPCVELGPGEFNDDLDAGIYEPINIGDYVWYDDDRDGIQDPDETGVEGVTVNLVSAGPDGLFHTTDDVIVDTQITDANGNYLFEDVAPGLYCIEFVGSTLPADYVFTLTDQGGDDEADSDAAADGKTEPFTVVGGQDDDLSFDAGINLPTASLGDYVWEDTDQDGVQDPDEMGVEGVTVSLYICGEDTPIATTTTDENGFYIFEGLEPNTEYYVVFSDLPAEYVFTDADQGGDEALDSDAGDNGETPCVELGPGEFNDDLDAGIYEPINIGDYVWYDDDRDGIQDPDETGVEGVTVNLVSAGPDGLFHTTDDVVVDTQITDANGNYLFEDVAPGLYCIEFVGSTLPADYVFTLTDQGGDDEADSDAAADGKTEPFTVVGGQDDDLSFDAGINLPTASLGDYVWEDTDQDGVQDPDEMGVEGVTVSLYICGEDTPIATTTTDENGFYIFEGLEPNTEYYVVFSDLPAEYVFTDADQGGDEALDSDAGDNGETPCVELGPGEFNDDLDAGIYEPINIGDYVWYDDDRDGIQDPDETGVEGVTVNLVSAGPDGLFHTTDDVVVDTQITDANGNYLFEDVAPGLYCIEFVGSTLPADYVFTLTDQGGDDEADSDAAADGKTDPFTVVGGQDDDLSFDAGIFICTDIVISDAPQDQTILCSDDIPEVVDPVFTDPVEGILPSTFTEVQNPLDCQYEIVRTWMASNDCGNTASHTQTITVVDDIAPEFDLACQFDLVFTTSQGADCPADAAISLTLGQEIDVTTGWNVAGFDIPALGGCVADNCTADLDLIIRVVDLTNTGDDCSRVLTVTFVAEDECGNVSGTFTCTYTIIDDEAPIAPAAPADMTAQCVEDVPAPGDLTAQDACQGPISATGVDSDNGGAGCTDDPLIITRTWTFDDGCGNVSSVSKTITVIDDIAPEFDLACQFDLVFTTSQGADCPADAAISLTLGQEIDVTTGWNVAGFDIPALGGCVADNCTADLDLIIRVVDLTNTGDDCSRVLTVTFVAEDECGNISGTFTCTYTIIDDEAPVPPVVDDMTAQCLEDVPAPGDLSADDACQGPISATGVDSDNGGAGCTDDPLIITRTWTFDDGCGNVSSVSKTITVVDDTPPVVLQGNTLATVECDEFSCGYDILLAYVADELTPEERQEARQCVAALFAQLGLTPTGVDDNCDDLGWEETEIDFMVLDECENGLKAYLVCYFQATDECGNASAVVTSRIDIVDTTAPSLSVNPDATVECGEDFDLAGSDATDDCGDVSVAVDSVFNPSCGDAGTWVFTYVATDDCGNTATDTQTITVIDTTDPVITTFPEDVTVECDAVPAVNTTDVVGFVGEFAPENWTIQLGDVDDSVSVTTTEIYIAGSDVSPTNFTAALATCPITGSYSFDWDWLSQDSFGPQWDPGFYVNGNLAIQLTDNSGDSIQSGSLTVNCQAGDVIGFAVEGDFCCGTGFMTITNFTVGDATVDVSATDNCSDPAIAYLGEVRTDGDCSGEYLLTRTWSATDACGNSVTQSQTITVIDTQAPSIDVEAMDETVDCSTGAAGSCTYSVQLFDSFGDGWQGDTVDVLVNGVVVLEGLALPDSAGVSSGDPIPVPVSSGDVISIVQTAVGQWPGEPEWRIFDSEDNEVAFGDVDNAAEATVSCPGDAVSSDELFAAWLADNAGAEASDTCGEVTWSNDSAGLSDDCGATGSATVTFTATDECGNTATTTATFNVIDTTPPSLEVADDVTIECDQPLPAPDATASDECGDATWTVTAVVTEDSICDLTYTMVRTYVATDECGNTNTATQTLTVVDTTAPVTPPAPVDMTAQCLDDVPPPSELTAQDACQGPITVTGVDTDNGGAGCVGDPLIITRTWTFDDGCGNVSSVSKTITVIDDTPPTATCPDDVTVECGESTLSSETGKASGGDGDACGLVTINQSDSIVPGCGETFTIYRTWIVSDLCGNTTTCVQVISVVDTTAPGITANADATVECGDDLDLGGATADDSCGDVTVTADSTFVADCGETGTWTIVYTATDECGNTAQDTQTITIIDTSKPIVNIDNTQSEIECSDFDCGLDLLEQFAAGQLSGTAKQQFRQCVVGLFNSNGLVPSSVNDNCDDDLNFTEDSLDVIIYDECVDGLKASIICYFSATDDCGNIADVVSSQLDIIDTTAPEWNFDCQFDANFTTSGGAVCPSNADISLVVGQEITVNDTWNVGGITIPSLGNCVLDNCTDDLIIRVTEKTNTGDDCSKTLSITFEAEDECGNIAGGFTCTYIFVDDEAPTAPTQDDITFACVDDVPAPGDLTAQDACQGPITATGVDTDNGGAGCADDPLIITRTWTFDDGCGNVSSVSKTITVVDDIAPLFDLACQFDLELTTSQGADCPADAAISLTLGQEIDVTTGWNVAGFDIPALGGCVADNCTADLDLIIRVVDLTNTGDDCSRVLTVTFVAEDECGNVSGTFTCTYTIIDDEAPIAPAAPADMTAQCVEDVPAPGDLTAQDACQGPITVTGVDSDNGGAGCTDDPLIITRTWTFDDGCGNISSVSKTITVKDETPPTITCPADIIVECGESTSPLSTGKASGGDECGEVFINHFDSIQAGCGNSQVIIRSWRVTDECGNSTVCVQTITVEDNQSPEVIMPSEATAEISCADFSCGFETAVDFVDGNLDSVQKAEFRACLSDIFGNSGLVPVGVYDVCSEDLNWTEDSVSIEVFGDCNGSGQGSIVGIATCYFSAVDECGNVSDVETSQIVFTDNLDPEPELCIFAQSKPVDLNKSFNPVNGVYDRVQVKWYKDSPEIRYQPEDNVACEIQFVAIRDLLNNVPIVGADTSLIGKHKVRKPGQELFKWPIKFNRPDVEPYTRYLWRVRTYCDDGAGDVSPWSDWKVFNTPGFDPSTGIYTPSAGMAEGSGSDDDDLKLFDIPAIQFDLFPNPTDVEVNIDVDLAGAEKGVLIITDMVGNVVMEMEIGPSKKIQRLILDTSELATGSYLVSIITDSDAARKQLVIHH